MVLMAGRREVPQPREVDVPQRRFGDVLVLLPGLTGSVLRKDGKDLWGPSVGTLLKAALSRGGRFASLVLEEDPVDREDLGDGVVANVLLEKSKGQNSGWIVIAAGWGFAVAIAVYVAGWASGAHINPVVSLSFWLLKKLSLRHTIGYIIAQFSGAVLGALPLLVAHFLRREGLGVGRIALLAATMLGGPVVVVRTDRRRPAQPLVRRSGEANVPGYRRVVAALEPLRG